MNGVEGGRNKCREDRRFAYKGLVVSGSGRRNQQKGAETRKKLYRSFFRVERTALAGNYDLLILDGAQYKKIATYPSYETAHTMAAVIKHAFKVKTDPAGCGKPLSSRAMGSGAPLTSCDRSS